MPEYKLYKSPFKAVRLLVLSAPFVAAGIWLMVGEANAAPIQKLCGLTAVGFFGLGIVLGCFHLFDRRPQIIINQNGIWDRTTRQDEIKWNQIQKVYIVYIRGQKFISLKVDKTFIWKNEVKGWVKRLNRIYGLQDINLQLSQLKIDEKRFASFIRKMSKIKQPYYSEAIDAFFQSLMGRF